MKCLPSIFMLVSVLFVTACSSLPADSDTASGNRVSEGAPLPKSVRAPQSANKVRVQDAGGSVIVQKVEFRPGVSSVTVERLARRHGCTSDTGAGLITEKGPVEVYRVQCDNGKTFLARCEFRQCRPMH